MNIRCVILAGGLFLSVSCLSAAEVRFTQPPEVRRADGKLLIAFAV